MVSVHRQRKVMELITQHGECSIEYLAKALGVSEMTIRRDLQKLAASGKILRTHGGAAVAERVAFEFEFLKRAEENRNAKAAIAKCASAMVEDGQSVLLDSGTTTLAIASQLQMKKNITVVTTSLPAASKLQFCSQINVLLLGGYVRPSAPDLVGALTETNLESLHADVAFVGASGIDRRGRVYQQSPEVARLLSKMLNSASRAYVVADGSKLDKSALCRFGRLQDVAGLITDAGADEKFVGALRKAGAHVIIA